jgi:probable rRNA maturation factor
LSIYFHSENIKFLLQGKRKIKNWLKIVCEDHNCKVGNVNVIFVDNRKILEINNTYLKHNYYTDIITFDYSANNIVAGDLYINVDSVKENSLEYKVEFSIEIYRVIVHGLLHLLGYNDFTPEEKVVMREKEDHYINFLSNIN